MCIQLDNLGLTLLGAILAFIGGIVGDILLNWKSRKNKKINIVNSLKKELLKNKEILEESDNINMDLIFLYSDTWESIVSSGFYTELCGEEWISLVNEVYSDINMNNIVQLSLKSSSKYVKEQIIHIRESILKNIKSAMEKI